MKLNENIYNAARENDNFRRVFITGAHSQVVLMSLAPNEDIGEEVHKVDQLLFLVQGQGNAVLEGKSEDITTDDLVFVKAGQRHNVIAGNHGLKLFTVYAPPQHRPGVVHKTKTEAEADESDHYENN